MAPIEDVCGLPFALYLKDAVTRPDGSVESRYVRPKEYFDRDRTKCSFPSSIRELRVIRSQPMSVVPGVGPNLERQCCTKYEIEETESEVPTIFLGPCEGGQKIAPRWEQSQFQKPRLWKPNLKKQRRKRAKTGAIT